MAELTKVRLERRSELRAAEAVDWTMARMGLAKPVVLLSGFFRSGTTWLQECLAEALDAKTVFEPLSPMIPTWRHDLARAGYTGAVTEGIFPFSAPPDDPLWSYLDKAFLAVNTGRFGLTCRGTILESLRRKIVIKDVRLQFNLAEVHARYDLPVVHIRRRPIAAIESLLRANWYWSFDDFSMRETFPTMYKELQPFDTDALSRISAYWAVTERAVEKTLAGQPWARMVSYEDMRAQPLETIADLCRFIGQTQQRAPNVLARSASNWGAAEAGSSPLNVPKPSVDAGRVREIIEALFPEWEGA